MSLSQYRRRRNFEKTPEPLGEKTNSLNKRIFVVQRHKSSILHYDLRLEIGGVLKSWAIPKGPSMNINDKRLAIQVEDYPLSYASFKGIIPEGNYGAGIIEVWDKGLYIPHTITTAGLNDRQILKQFKEGRLKFSLKGKKLKGVFSLVRINGSDSWLLIKGNDKFAVDYPYNSEDYTSVNSLINKSLKEMNEYRQHDIQDHTNYYNQRRYGTYS